MKWPLLVAGETFRALEAEHDKCQLALSQTHAALSRAERVIRDKTKELKKVTDRHTLELANVCRAQQVAAAQREWCPAQFAELPAELRRRCPRLVEATDDALRCAVMPEVRCMSMLVNQHSFRSASMWALYWVVVHGAEAVRERILDGINEDGLTTAFAAAISNATAEYQRRFSNNIDLQIGFTKLYEHAGENLQEVDAGADLVLVVSGNQLTPGGGARLLWFQAKRRRRPDNPWRLAYGQENSKHGTQCAALKRRHSPAQGSFGSYVNYAEGVPVVAAVPVELLDEKGTSVDVNDVGIRLQEHVLSRATAVNAGQFTSAEGVFDFLTEEDSSSGLPIEVMTLDSPDSCLGQMLVAQIRELDQQRRRERNRGQGYGY